MIKVHFLKSVRDNSKITWDFYFPVSVCESRLRARGYEVALKDTTASDAADCDLLVVLSSCARYHRDDPRELERFIRWTETHPGGAFFDIGDSPGAFYRGFAERARRYFKKQLYYDRAFYSSTDHRDSRTHIDHYVKKYDLAERTIPSHHFSPAALERIQLSWNVGVGDYRSFFVRPQLFDRYLILAQYRIAGRYVSVPGFRDHYEFVPFSERKHDVLSLFSDYRGISEALHRHRRETIEAIERLRVEPRARGLDIVSGFLSPRDYRRALRASRAGVCPFGWGEISWKDFEMFQKGVAIIKPDMSHIETWPNYYLSGETYLSYRWDAADLGDRIVEAFNGEKIESIAREGQRRFAEFDVLRNPQPFVERFCAVMAQVR